jgi:hypothetical protein
MNKRKLNHELHQLKAVPIWTFLFLSIVFGLIAVFSLRSNNQKMIDLKDAVFAADEQDGDIETALKELREHVYGHMNTNLAAGDNAIKPPIQLKYRYERLLAAEQAKFGNTNEALYTAAQNHCEQQNPGGFSGSNRIPCIKEYIDAHGGEVKLAEIPKEAYMFDFVSPSWSPDMAGWSIVLAIIFFVLFILHVFAEYFINKRIHEHA